MTKRDVLYVDDESENLIVFQATFEDRFNVVTATSGQEALELMAQRTFPVVVADQRMPRMSGAQLFEAMRDKFPHTKRVMLTGYADSKAMLVAMDRAATLGRSAAQLAHEMGNQLCMLPLLELIEERYSDQEELVQMAGF